MVLLSLMVVACERPAGGLTELPAYDFTNGPDELPNVLRSQTTFAVNIMDPGSGLRVFAGLPALPAAHVACQVFGPPFNGTEQFQLQNEQLVGTEPPFVYLLNTADVNLHVYQLSTFMGFCRSTIYAQGSGKLMGTDNDLTGSGTRSNVWGFHMTGDVTLATTGQSAQLNAFVRFLAGPNGFQILARKVALH
jgi:hypothetical protein